MAGTPTLHLAPADTKHTPAGRLTTTGSNPRGQPLLAYETCPRLAETYFPAPSHITDLEQSGPCDKKPARAASTMLGTGPHTR